MNRIKGKKGFAEFIVVFLLIGFGLAVFYVGLKAQNAFSDNEAGQTDATIVSTAVSQHASGFNVGMMVAVGLLFVGAIITATLVDVNPIWIWIGFLIFGFVAYFIISVAPVTSVIINNQTFAREINQTPQAAIVSAKIGLLIVGAMLIFFVALYAKLKGAGGSSV